MQSKAPLILASGSAIRQHMLKAVGVAFGVEPSGIDENESAATVAAFPPAERALALAKAKALAVSKLNPKAYVIGADQMCVIGETVLQKPGSFDKAEAQLALLSGKTHHQHCGTVIAHNGAIVWENISTATLEMRALSKDEIHAYIGADAPLSSCGSYKFESLGRHLFASVDGDHDVIQGLPLTALLAQLHELKLIALA